MIYAPYALCAYLMPCTLLSYGLKGLSSAFVSTHNSEMKTEQKPPYTNAKLPIAKLAYKKNTTECRDPLRTFKSDWAVRNLVLWSKS